MQYGKSSLNNVQYMTLNILGINLCLVPKSIRNSHKKFRKKESKDELKIKDIRT